MKNGLITAFTTSVLAAVSIFVTIEFGFKRTLDQLEVLSEDAETIREDAEHMRLYVEKVRESTEEWITYFNDRDKNIREQITLDFNELLATHNIFLRRLRRDISVSDALLNVTVLEFRTNEVLNSSIEIMDLLITQAFGSPNVHLVDASRLRLGQYRLLNHYFGALLNIEEQVIAMRKLDALQGAKEVAYSIPLPDEIQSANANRQWDQGSREEKGGGKTSVEKIEKISDLLLEEKYVYAAIRIKLAIANRTKDTFEKRSLMQEAQHLLMRYERQFTVEDNLSDYVNKNLKKDPSWRLLNLNQYPPDIKTSEILVFELHKCKSYYYYLLGTFYRVSKEFSVVSKYMDKSIREDDNAFKVLSLSEGDGFKFILPRYFALASSESTSDIPSDPEKIDTEISTYVTGLKELTEMLELNRYSDLGLIKILVLLANLEYGLYDGSTVHIEKPQEIENSQPLLQDVPIISMEKFKEIMQQVDDIYSRMEPHDRKSLGVLLSYFYFHYITAQVIHSSYDIEFYRSYYKRIRLTEEYELIETYSRHQLKALEFLVVCSALKKYGDLSLPNEADWDGTFRFISWDDYGNMKGKKLPALRSGLLEIHKEAQKFGVAEGVGHPFAIFLRFAKDLDGINDERKTLESKYDSRIMAKFEIL